MTSVASPPVSTAEDAAPARSVPLSAHRGLTARQWEELALAFVLTIAANRFPRWPPFERAWVADLGGVKALPWHWYVSLVFLGLGLLLALPSRERSGLRIGAIREHWRGVLGVCGGAVLATALVYPQLPTRPWGDQPATMWLTSPLSQGLIFIGYLYGRLERAFPGHVHPRVPLARALVLTCLFFALWHVPNFAALPAGYVAFQLFYTGVLALVPGLSRQWTGSILYAVATHMAVNLIAWAAS